MSFQQTPASGNVLQHLRFLASRINIGVLWVYVAAQFLVAFFSGSGIGIALGFGIAFSLIPTVFWLRDPSGLMTRGMVAAGLACHWMLLIYAASFLPDAFVLEAHMMYFITNMLILPYFCWGALAVVTAIPAVHHLILSFAYPMLVWPSSGYALAHFGTHVFYVLITVAITGWIIHTILGVFATNTEALHNIQEERLRSEELARQQHAQENSAMQERQQALNSLSGRFQSMTQRVVDVLAHSAHDLRDQATGVSKAAQAATREAQRTADVFTHASHNVSAVASATEQLTRSIQEIGNQVSQSSRIANDAVAEVERTNSTVESLVSAAQKIGEVVKLINDIASQTNLLALNATIEAARAGEAGKGFAVVASEVKNLANQTAKATEEISSQITEMQSATTGAAEAIKGIGGTIGRINSVVSSIATAVEQQGAATREIVHNVESATAGTREAGGGIEHVIHAVEDAGRTADQMIHSSESLSHQAANLREEVESLIAQAHK